MSSRRALCLLASVIGLFMPVLLFAGQAGGFQATGIKISEPTATSVTIWTRLTRDEQRAPDDRPLPKLKVCDRNAGKELPLRDNGEYPGARVEIAFPAGSDLGSIRGAAVGAAGQVRVRYRVASGAMTWTESPWRAVDERADFTATFALASLQPGTRYEIVVEGRRVEAAPTTSVVSGGFVTAPAPGAAGSVSFCVMTCQQYEDRDRPDGFAIYPAMLGLRPDFFVNTGDAVYYDHGPVHALTVGLARYHWARMFSFSTLVDFHRQVGSYFMKDDHDTLTDDCHPDFSTGEFSFAEGVRTYREQTAPPNPAYRTIRWGRHLQIWMVEGREYRSTREQDSTHAPTIWGGEQIAWFERTMTESDATFRVLITPTPMVGPDRDAKDDNYANAGYGAEGERLRTFLAAQKNVLVITGDRHWQYVSVDPETKVEEWSVGAASDAHAGGWSENQPRAMHRFLRINHGGFLSGAVSATSDGASLRLRLHDTTGNVVFESTKTAAK